MGHTLIEKAAELFREKRRRRNLHRAVVALAAAVVFATTYMMILPAITMEADTVCGMEEHTHGDDCYELRLSCGKEEGEEELVGGHSHADSCYGYVCGQSEHEAHAHSDDCYGDVDVLSCGQSEHEAHSHSDACYEAEEVLSCGQSESEGHSHADSCYSESESLDCDEDHEHSSGCYTTHREKTCGQSESDGHSHSSGCYTTQSKRVCGQSETEGHSHSDACYTTEHKLLCTTAESDGHTHSDACVGLTCGREESNPVPAVHSHGDSCYERVLVCDLTEHTHTEACLPARELETPEQPGVFGEPALPDYTCGMEEHTHGEDCLDENGELICEIMEHTHDDSCQSETPVVPEEPELPAYICGMEEHTHGEDCLDENGELICEITEHTHDDSCVEAALPETPVLTEQTLTAAIYTDGTYSETYDSGMVITVSGMLPENAQLRAFPAFVEPDSDEMYIMFAYDITVFAPDADGEMAVWEPEDNTLQVNIQVPGLNSDTELEMYHIPDDGEARYVDSTTDDDGNVLFETDHFSVFYGVTFFSLPQEEDVETAQKVAVTTTENTRVDGGTVEEKGQITEGGGMNTSKESDGVSVSKTIAPTDIENVFDITLQVKTKTKVEEMKKAQSLDVVIVMDVSYTMKDRIGNNTNNPMRYQAAIGAAQNFIDQFQESSANVEADVNRRIALVTFNTHGQKQFDLTSCKTGDEATNLKNTLSSKVNAIFDASNYNGQNHNRFTNMEAGLNLANKILGRSNAANKYVIFLTDGFPTTWGLNNGDESKAQGGLDPVDPEGKTFKNGYRDDAPCIGGTSYSDHAATYAENHANALRKTGSDSVTNTSNCAGAKVFVIGVDVAGQSIERYEEIDRLYMNDNSVIEAYGHSVRGKKYVIGNAKDDFTLWLKNYISNGEGYYYNSNDDQALSNAFQSIFATIKKQVETKINASWVAEDPITSVDDGTRENYIEFIQFFQKDGTAQNSLTGSAVVGGENTAAVSANTQSISWDLKNSGYTSKQEDNTTYYTYSLTYRVRLRNEKIGFVDSQSYKTNGTTSLTYREVTNGTLGKLKLIEFPVPQVKGYVEKLTFTKVTDDKAPLEGAKFTLTHSTDCKLCRGDGTAVDFEKTDVTYKSTYEAVSDADGTVTFENIPSGHDYVLKETEAPVGYTPVSTQYTVKVHYNDEHTDGTITVETLDDVFYQKEGDGSYIFVNVGQPALPETGGPGTTWLTVAGTLSTLGAGALLILNKRRKGAGRVA